MRTNSILFFIALLAVSLTARADYLQVNRSATVYAEPNRSSDVVFNADAESNLLMADSETENGYYHVQDPNTGQTGWIYRALVRRYKGDIPKTENRSGKAFLGKGANRGGFPEKACKIPYNEEPSDTSAFDRSCGLEGDAKPKSGEAAQNPHKNYLCASGVAQEITSSDLIELQKEVDDSGMEYGSPFSGKPGPPLDRSKLGSLPPLGNGLKLEEGSLVSFVGYLADAHYMPKSPVKPPKKGGETVNCHLTNHEEADIHLAISSSPGRISAKDPQKEAKLCKTISAEMIPHLRPGVWNRDNLDQVIDLDRPVRILGQLFFDASHEPCEKGAAHGSDPRRATVWEIHPVYTFEVCKFDDLRRCDPGKPSNWQPLSQAAEVDVKDEEQDE
jgi:hypothetical protein